jgi:hypothetical protein
MMKNLALVTIGLLLAASDLRGAGYDPLAVPPDFHAQTQDLMVHDEARHRNISVRIRDSTDPALPARFDDRKP